MMPTSSTDGDNDSALLELLEFVDAWAPDATSSPRSEGSACGSATRSDASDSPTAGRRQRNREVDMRRRQKKKRERDMLKLSVDELSERLERLQRAKLAKTAEAGDRGWMLTEEDNKALKSKMAINLAVISALQDAISPNLVDVQLDATVVAHALEMQRESLKEMLANNRAVFRKFPPLLESPFLLRSETKVDASGNPRVELLTAVEVDRNLPQVAMLFGSGLRQTSPFWSTVCNCIETEGQVAERAFALGDRVLDFQKSNLRSVGLVQKHQYLENCLVVMWSSQIFHPTAGVTIVSRTRICVTSVSSSRSLIQAVTDLSAHAFVDSPSLSEVPPSQSQAVRNVLVRAFGDRLGAKHKLMLKILLQATGRDDVASLVA